MTHIWHGLRSDSWLTPARGRNRPDRSCSGSVPPDGSRLRTHRSSRNGWPTGADFSCLFAAGALALEGRAGDAYDPQDAPRTYGVQREHALLPLALSADVFFLAAPLHCCRVRFCSRPGSKQLYLWVVTATFRAARQQHNNRASQRATGYQLQRRSCGSAGSEKLQAAFSQASGCGAAARHSPMPRRVRLRRAIQ